MTTYKQNTLLRIMCQLLCFVIMYAVKHCTELWVIVRICHPDKRQMLDYLAL